MSFITENRNVFTPGVTFTALNQYQKPGLNKPESLVPSASGLVLKGAYTDLNIKSLENG